MGPLTGAILLSAGRGRISPETPGRSSRPFICATRSPEQFPTWPIRRAMGTRDLPTRRPAQVSRPALGEALLHVQIPSTSLKSATLGRRALPEWPSGVYGIPRREPATESGMQVDAVLGGAKAINFQPT